MHGHEFSISGEPSENWNISHPPKKEIFFLERIGRLKFSAFLVDAIIGWGPHDPFLATGVANFCVLSEKAMIKKLIRCSKCDQVIPNYEGYAILQAQSLPGVECSSADLAEAKEFLITHSSHPLEDLSIETDSLISEKPAHEAIGVTYFFARKVDRKFLIRRTKIALDQPASYEIIPGKLKILNVSLKIQEYGLRNQIAMERGFSLLLKRKMEKFIESFRDEMAGISIDNFEEEAERIEEGETSLIAYGGLKDFRWERILDRCSRYFKESELSLVRRFIEDNRKPPDVLSIRIQRSISVISIAETESIGGVQGSEQIGMAEEAEPNAVSEKKA